MIRSEELIRIVPLERVKWSIYGTWFYILNYFCPESNQKSNEKLATINAATSASPDVPLPWAKWLVIMSRLWFSVGRVIYGKLADSTDGTP
jgi:hypothetical protein